MGLSCSCSDYEAEPGSVLWYPPEDYQPLDTKRGRKCCSCGENIKVGDLACKVERIKVPENDIEVRIYGEDGEVPLAPRYMCERCADLSFSLAELGYCEQPFEDQRELVADYAYMHGTRTERKE